VGRDAERNRNVLLIAIKNSSAARLVHRKFSPGGRKGELVDRGKRKAVVTPTNLKADDQKKTSVGIEKEKKKKSVTQRHSRPEEFPRPGGDINLLRKIPGAGGKITEPTPQRLPRNKQHSTLSLPRKQTHQPLEGPPHHHRKKGGRREGIETLHAGSREGKSKR